MKIISKSLRITYKAKKISEEKRQRKVEKKKLRKEKNKLFKAAVKHNHQLDASELVAGNLFEIDSTE